MLRREDYLPPGGSAGGRPPLLGRPRPLGDIAAKRKAASGDNPPPQRSGPAIKLAPLPTASQPTAPAPANEPAPQKPDLKLPIDAIRASRAGGAGAKPLSEHLKKHEQKRKADQAPAAPSRGQSGAGSRTPAAAPSTGGAAGPGRDRSRRPLKPGQGEDPGGLGGRERRQLNRKAAAGRRRDDDDSGPGSRGPRGLRRLGTNTAAPRKTKVTIELPCTVRSLSQALGLPAARIQAKLLEMKVMASITSNIDRELAEMLAVELGIEADFRSEEDRTNELLEQLRDLPTDAEQLAPRAPVITFLGHVDHGKTSLLDKLIGINVASGESGGITQHIRAYQIDKNGRKISFVDTPGHEAFTQMRARGANVTDIAVLVVAADDGVMPQTEEAIAHARAAGVPIVIALNKIDLPGVDTQRIYQQLATAGLLPTEWGGDTELVKTSATTGQGLDDLLDTLLTIAELHEYKANANRPAFGTCLESELHEGRGVISKFLVQRGTLRVGDVVVCGAAHGRVKALYDTLRPSVAVTEAGPSTPVDMTGLDVPPGAGEHFYVLSDIAQARGLAEQRAQQMRNATLGGQTTHVTLETLYERLGGEEVQTLNVILRADVQGSIEAIIKELGKLDHPEVKIRVLHKAVGGITEADIHLADASDAIVIGFNVVPDDKARSLADRQGVQVRRYEIIYKVTEDVKSALEGMLKPEQRDVELGRALVQRVYTISRIGSIAGCRVLSGVIQRNGRVRLIRENRVIGDYGLDSLKREKDDAREVREGLECGIKLAGYNDIKEGDVLEAYKVEEVARAL